jgi:hypothetical protein
LSLQSPLPLAVRKKKPLHRHQLLWLFQLQLQRPLLMPPRQLLLMLLPLLLLRMALLLLLTVLLLLLPARWLLLRPLWVRLLMLPSPLRTQPRLLLTR